MDERTRISIAIDEADNRGELERLKSEAEAHGDPQVRSLRIKAILKLGRLPRMGDVPRPTRILSPPASVARFGLSPVPGKPLFAYRLRDDTFRPLEREIAALGTYHALEHAPWPQLFVLWASEWFRRHYRGGGHRWADLVARLGLPEDQGRLRALTATGLKAWGLPVLRAAGGREYLASLARQGGFPVAAVEGGGWAGTLLKALVAPLLAEPGAGTEQALTLARARRDTLPQIFRDDEFLQLCADLALAVVKIRRDADAAARAAGLPLAAWLDRDRPDWRDALPLSVDSAGAEALLGDLLAVEAAAVGGAGVRVERLLVRGAAGRWEETIRLTLDGPIEGEVMRGIGADSGRLRLFAAGDFARALPGELAILEPPGEGETSWTARSNARSRGARLVPFSAAIECDLRSGEERVARICLPGGKPRRGQLLACTVAQGDADSPDLLRVESSGSGAFVAETVILQAPREWTVEAMAEGERVSPLGPGVDDTLLWRVDGGATVTDTGGDCVRIRTGQTHDRRDRIEIDDHPVRWATVDGDVDLFAGPPSVRCSDRRRGALFIRPVGTGRSAWRPAPTPLPVGRYEIGWRDGQQLLDRRQLAVVPRAAELHVSGHGREARWCLSGWEGVTIRPTAKAPVSDNGSVWRARPTAQAAHWFEAEIGWPDTPPLTVRIPFPTEAAIARWDGGLLASGAGVTLADLPGLVAVSPGRMTMYGELVEAGGRAEPAVMRWTFCDELPMSSAAADIASMLLPASNDAVVRLAMLDGTDASWLVRPFAVSLERSGGGLAAVTGVAASDVEVCARAFVDPAHEVSLGAYSLVSDANHRPFGLPAGSRGDWIVYLRDGNTVVSRPQILGGDLPAAEQPTPLARAMAIPPWAGLGEALDAVLWEAGEGTQEGEATVDALVTLAASLRGLPPSSFEVLRRLPSHPAVLTRMVLRAGDEQVASVLALSDGLPFAWCTLPKRDWDAAGVRQFEVLLSALSGIEGAVGYAGQALAHAISVIVGREPLLAPVLMGGSGNRREAEMVFARRVIDSDAAGQGTASRYRARGLALPADHMNLPAQVLEWLDTPYAAALAVTGAWTPRAADVRHIKTVARTFPTFFADTFAASLGELS